jgi:hypothetical protein
LLLNSELSLQVAQVLGRRAARAPSVEARAEVLWRELLSRAPSQAECELLSQLLDDWEDDAAESALVAAALALLNSNEFVCID